MIHEYFLRECSRLWMEWSNPSNLLHGMPLNALLVMPSIMHRLAEGSESQLSIRPTSCE